MMEQCVIRVVSNRYLEFVGNVPSVPIMIYARSVTMGINIIYDIGNFQLCLWG